MRSRKKVHTISLKNPTISLYYSKDYECEEYSMTGTLGAECLNEYELDLIHNMYVNLEFECIMGYGLKPETKFHNTLKGVFMTGFDWNTNKFTFNAKYLERREI